MTRRNDSTRLTPMERSHHINLVAQCRLSTPRLLQPNDSGSIRHTFNSHPRGLRRRQELVTMRSKSMVSPKTSMGSFRRCHLQYYNMDRAWRHRPLLDSKRSHSISRTGATSCMAWPRRKLSRSRRRPPTSKCHSTGNGLAPHLRQYPPDLECHRHRNTTLLGRLAQLARQRPSLRANKCLLNISRRPTRKLPCLRRKHIPVP